MNLTAGHQFDVIPANSTKKQSQACGSFVTWCVTSRQGLFGTRYWIYGNISKPDQRPTCHHYVYQCNDTEMYFTILSHFFAKWMFSSVCVCVCVCVAWLSMDMFNEDCNCVTTSSQDDFLNIFQTSNAVQIPDCFYLYLFYLPAPAPRYPDRCEPL